MSPSSRSRPWAPQVYVKSALPILGPLLGENSLAAFSVRELLPVDKAVRTSYWTVTVPVKFAKIDPVCARLTLDCTTATFPIAPMLTLRDWVPVAVAANADSGAQAAVANTLFKHNRLKEERYLLAVSLNECQCATHT